MSLDAFATIAAKFSERDARAFVEYLGEQSASTPLLAADILPFLGISRELLNNVLDFATKSALLDMRQLAFCTSCRVAIEDRTATGEAICDLCDVAAPAGVEEKFYFTRPEVSYVTPQAKPVVRTLAMNKHGDLFTSEALLKAGRIRPWNGLRPEDYVISVTTFNDAVEKGIIDRIERIGFCLLRHQGLSPSNERLLALEHSVGVACTSQNGAVGKIKEITPKEAVDANTGDSAKELAPHTDGTQNDPMPPALLVFEYLTGSSFGGQSNFTDLTQVLLEMEPGERDEILKALAQPDAAVCEKKGLRYEGPLVRNVCGGLALSFRLRFDDKITVKESARAAFETLRNRIMNRAERVTYLPQEGDIVVFDNWRVLHGRHAIGGRHQRFHNRMWIESLANRHEILLGVRGIQPASLALVGP